MSRTKEDLERMMREDSDIGLNFAHYRPMEKFIKERNYKSGIEVGTAYGGLANHLLSTCELDLLITIDPYKFYPDMPGLFDQEDYDNLRQQTKERLRPYPQCKMYRLSSKGFIRIQNDVLESDRKYSFIFIDGLHKYETIKWECENYQHLVKPGGALMGHDWDIFEDVNKAVIEFSKSVNKELFTLPGNIWYLNY